MTSEAQKRANKEYRKKNVKRVTIDFFPADEDVYLWLKSQKGMARYLKDLIRADMASKK